MYFTDDSLLPENQAPLMIRARLSTTANAPSITVGVGAEGWPQLLVVVTAKQISEARRLAQAAVYA
jgi:hypothetical protein